MSFWREVFDLSEEAETPARAMASRQVGLVLGAVSAAGFVVLGVLSHWSSPVLTPVGTSTLIGLGMAVGASLRLRRLRRARRARARVRRRAPGVDR